MASCAAHTLSTRVSRLAPCSTYTFQGWQLVPEGARRATLSMASIALRGTGLSRRNARHEKRVSIAVSTLPGSSTTVLTWVWVT
jgi:hypothetical protein